MIQQTLIKQNHRIPVKPRATLTTKRQKARTSPKPEPSLPYGLDASGRLTHVSEVPRGKACNLNCPSCKSPLKANKGEKRQHYLSHMVRHTACEGWLHATAKYLVHRRIKDAIEAGSPLNIEWQCAPEARCMKKGTGPKKRRDLLGKGKIDQVLLETPIPKWRIKPDITLYSGTEPAVLVEIVDTHAPEEPVLKTGIPVIEIHVSDEETLIQLEHENIPAAAVHNYPCPKCREIKAQEIRKAKIAKARKERQKAIEQALEQKRKIEERTIIREIRTGPHRTSNGKWRPINPITHDKEGSPLYPHLRIAADKTARSLQAAGFAQRPSRPTLFNYILTGIPGGTIKIFADLDSTDTIKMWENFKEYGTIPAALYAFPEDHQHRKFILQKFRNYLRKRKIPYRRYFFDQD